MRSTAACIVIALAGAAGWWWLSKSAVVASVSLVLGVWSLLRTPREDRTPAILVGSPIVPGFFAALVEGFLKW